MKATTPPRNATGHFLGDTPMLPIVAALNNCLLAIRSRHADIGNVVLVVGSTGRTKSGLLHGHFHADTWEAKNATHEIMLSGESLKRGAEDTLGTLLHECVHVLAHARGIKDTSRQGRFHNAKFKALAEEVGIQVHHDRSIGWSVTTLPKETAKLYRAELTSLRKALKAYRLPASEQAKPKTTIRLATHTGRKVTVPIKFYEQGGIFDAISGEEFLPVEELES